MNSRALNTVFCLAVQLCLVGCSSVQHVGDVLSGNTAYSRGIVPIKSDQPDDRREGIVWLVRHDYGREPVYTALYKQLAQRDPDPLVRSMAVRALNISRDASATKVFISALTDDSPLVRLEAAKALYRLPDPAAAEPLLAMVRKEDEPKDNRIAAAEALQHYKRLDVGRALVDLLNQRDFGLAWQARRTLKRLTGQELGYDENAWLQYITSPAKPLG